MNKFNEIRIREKSYEISRDYQFKNIYEEIKKINHNIQITSRLEGLNNEKLIQLIGKYSYFDLQRLDITLEELSKTEYEGSIVYQKVTGVYGSINYNVLEAIFKKIGDRKTLTDLEQKIFKIGSFIMGGPAPSFDPYNLNLEYVINDNDNQNTKLIKTLFNIIYKNQEKLILYAQNTGNELELTFNDEQNKFYPSDLDNKKISNKNLAKLLGITPGMLGDWIRIIELTYNVPVSYKPNLDTFIKIKLFIEENPFYNSIKDIQNLMINVLDHFTFNNIIDHLQYIFSKYSKDMFSAEKLSKRLGMSKNYLYKFKKGIEGVEEHTKYFRLLVNVYLSNPENFNLRDENDFQKLKEEVHDLVFNTMIVQGKIKDKNYRLDFDAIFYSILALSKAKLSTPEVQYGLYPLTKFAKIISPKDSRDFFRQKMIGGKIITNIQAELMMDEIRKISKMAPKYSQLALDRLEAIIERHREFVKDDYIKYYWGFLYEIQTMELLRITLGLDIWGLKFFEDAELDKKGKHKIDIARHHLEKIKSIYTIFKFKTTDFSEKLIPFEDFVIALAPLMQEYHNKIEFSGVYNYNMQLAMHRLMHLYELIQIPFSEGIDFQSRFLGEFRSKIATINGEQIKIWQKLDGKIINDWIKKWYVVKKEGYEAFLTDDEFGYPDFYKYRYLPIEEYYSLFLQGKRPKNAKLFLDENKRDKFWQWFLSVYLRENVYPII